MAALQMPVTPLLSNLVDGIVDATTLTAVPVSGVALDSRKLAPGYVFFALAGARQHGLDYFDAAIAADVAAILVDAGDARCSTQLQLRAASAGVALLPVPALAEQVGVIASRFFAQPSQSMTVIGVTGTDGKTSVSQYIAQALQRKNNPCGVIGTLGNGIFDNDKPGALTDSGLTTPDAVSVQHTLAGFQQRNITQVAMEVSSHALSQGRVNGVAFDVAVLTNLGRDHLDYHQTLENYHAAKWRLIQADSVRTAVVNIDDPVVRHCLAGHRKTNVIRYATDPAQRADADIFAEDIVLTGQGISMTVIYAQQCLPLHSPLIGHFNVSNLLATFATLCALGVDAHDSVARLAGLRAVPGRAERFSAGHCATAVVDYSHTPQALEAILRSMRSHCTGALWCLFGCGGDRDSGKRAPMGAVAENLADCLVITDDNPRHEDGDQIVRDIVSGLKNPDAATIERDREQAIRSVLRQARPEDWVVIAGKGHEDYQIIGDQRIDLSDRDIVTAAMREPGSA